MANASCSDLRALFLPTLGKLYSSKVDQAIGTLAFAISALCQLLLVMVTCSNSMAMVSEMWLHHGDADELNRELSILHRRLRSVLGYHFIKQIAHYTIALVDNCVSIFNVESSRPLMSRGLTRLDLGVRS
jgi:hypothetical protein